MRDILISTMNNISSFKNFYEIQKKYIDNKSKKGKKENRFGYLLNFYFSVLVNGSDKEKKRSTFKNLKKLVEEHIQVISIEDNGVFFKAKSNNGLSSENIGTAAKKYMEYAEMPRIHAWNTLVMLVTRFEEYISNFLRYIYNKYPQKYLDTQSIVFSEISNIGIDEIRNKIISREVDKKMRESYKEWFAIFKEHKMVFELCDKELENLNEIYACRNIIVHNAGIINDIYIKSIPDTNYKIGEMVKVDDKYIKDAFETIKTIIFYVFIEGIKLNKKESDLYFDEIFNLAYDELVAENYNTCKTIFYALSKNTMAKDLTKQMAMINFWIAKIETNGLDSVRSEITEYDVSALDKVFQFAKHVLLNEYDKAAPLMEELYTNKNLKLFEIEEWPLLKKYRKSVEYSHFKASHPELCGVISSETTKENLMDNTDATQSVREELNTTQSDEK